MFATSFLSLLCLIRLAVYVTILALSIDCLLCDSSARANFRNLPTIPARGQAYWCKWKACWCFQADQPWTVVHGAAPKLSKVMLGSWYMLGLFRHQTTQPQWFHHLQGAIGFPSSEIEVGLRRAKRSIPMSLSWLSSEIWVEPASNPFVSRCNMIIMGFNRGKLRS